MLIETIINIDGFGTFMTLTEKKLKKRTHRQSALRNSITSGPHARAQSQTSAKASSRTLSHTVAVTCTEAGSRTLTHTVAVTCAEAGSRTLAHTVAVTCAEASSRTLAHTAAETWARTRT
ncbi:hypothetical protein BC936DRAFT_149443 [Jimgerdemannia flammicorona]|uniref:Uncharacterized protein n=1 Tax=Jimgerdemannia flammicorona TaxID=994334 RepID=A0A433D0U0_9FUNG|nr:hypothetical protein BC936DRAFT_149443 [Jimgerdemannia flammicorona]